jgi:hypothetical protein
VVVGVFVGVGLGVALGVGVRVAVRVAVAVGVTLGVKVASATWVGMSISVGGGSVSSPCDPHAASSSPSSSAGR